jgi:hypothetical protein
MKKTLSCMVMTALLILGGAQTAEAQDRGLGGILDWINRLSGPRMIGPAATGWVSLGEVPRLRLSVAKRWSRTTDPKISPAGSRLSMWSIQPAMDFKVKGPLWLGGGVAIHRFGGDSDAFTHVSIPLYAQARVPFGDSRVRAVLSAGTHYFPKFDTGDFSPLTVTVERASGEFTFWWGAGIEIVWP